MGNIKTRQKERNKKTTQVIQGKRSLLLRSSYSGNRVQKGNFNPSSYSGDRTWGNFNPEHLGWLFHTLNALSLLGLIFLVQIIQITQDHVLVIYCYVTNYPQSYTLCIVAWSNEHLLSHTFLKSQESRSSLAGWFLSRISHEVASEDADLGWSHLKAWQWTERSISKKAHLHGCWQEAKWTLHRVAWVFS